MQHIFWLSAVVHYLSVANIESLLDHEPLLLDRTVCLPLYAMWPSYGYFSKVQVF